MGRGAETDDRLAGVEKGREVGDLVIGQLAEAGSNDHEIGGVQRGGSGDVLLEIRVDVAAGRVDGKKHDAIEAVFLAEDLGEHRAGFLAAVFLVARNEDNFFSVGSPGLGGKCQPIRGQGGCAAEKYGGKCGKKRPGLNKSNHMTRPDTCIQAESCVIGMGKFILIHFSEMGMVFLTGKPPTGPGTDVCDGFGCFLSSKPDIYLA